MPARLTKEDYKKVGIARGIEWVDTETPRSAVIKTQWRCSVSHIWLARYNSIQRGQGCPHCFHNAPLTLSDYRQYVSPVGAIWDGDTLPRRSLERTWWKCPKGHRWLSNSNNIRRGKNCPYCTNSVPLNIEDYRTIGISNGVWWCGDAIPKTANTVTWWTCKLKHRWLTTYGNIYNGTGCPACYPHYSKPEIELRDFLMWEFWDLEYNVTGLLHSKRLELDIYVPSLKKAIEFDGDHWHHSEWAIKHGVPDRDARKNQQCKDAGIELLRIKESEYKADPELQKQKALEFLSGTTPQPPL